jgi:hypothetical protein
MSLRRGRPATWRHIREARLGRQQQTQLGSAEGRGSNTPGYAAAPRSPPRRSAARSPPRQLDLDRRPTAPSSCGRADHARQVRHGLRHISAVLSPESGRSSRPAPRQWASGAARRALPGIWTASEGLPHARERGEDAAVRGPRPASAGLHAEGPARRARTAAWPGWRAGLHGGSAIDAFTGS